MRFLTSAMSTWPKSRRASAINVARQVVLVTFTIASARVCHSARGAVLFYGGDPDGNPRFTANGFNQKGFSAPDTFQYDDFAVTSGQQVDRYGTDGQRPF